MKRFWKEVAVEPFEGAWRVTLDGRPIRTQAGSPQVVPNATLAEALAAEWRAQGEEVDPKTLPLRDLADYAIDQVHADRASAIADLLRYAETDTLCYRADADEPLYRRQQEVWEPLVVAFETRHGVRLERVSGVIHRPQPPQTLARLGEALAALAPDADPAALFAAANCEEDWQAEQWGWDLEAERTRAIRLAAFEKAVEFARLARN